jgi:CelD/BcsL family acetyltransferase involved in cellulose biosynthesis
VKGRLIAVRHLSTKDERRWRDLAERVVEPNPLCEPDCLIPAARYQSFGDEISLVVAEEGDRFLACVPVRPVSRWYNIPYPVAANKVRRSTQVGTPLVDPSAGTTAVAALLTALAAERRALTSRLFGLDSLREGGPVAGHVRAAAARLGLPIYMHEDFERAFLIRRPDPTYLDGLSRSRRQTIRRRRRMLTDEFGHAPVLVDRSHDLSAIDEFVALEANGYKTRNGVALATVAGEPEYFRSMCERFAESKRLLVLSLECGGHTLGMMILLRGGDGLFGVKAAYDERYARFGPGVILHVDWLDYFHHATDARFVDTCASPDNTFLMGLYPDRTRISTLLLALHGRVDTLVVRSLPHVRALKKRVHTMISAPTPVPASTGSPAKVI